MLFGSTTATLAGAGSSAPPPAQVLSDLFDALATLMSTEVDAAARDQHDAEIAKVKDQIKLGLGVAPSFLPLPVGPLLNQRALLRR